MIGKVNAAIQVLTQGATTSERYKKVDKAIEILKNSGLPCEVTPFETVIEGDYDRVMEVFKQAHLAVLESEGEDALAIIKIQARKGQDVTGNEKTAKHR